MEDSTSDVLSDSWSSARDDQRPLTAQGPTAFVKVLYGDNEEALINPWCPNATFLRYILNTVECDGLDKTSDIDLVNLHGDVLDLKSRPAAYATDCLQGRRTYILCRIHSAASCSRPGSCRHYEPLYHNVEEAFPGLLENLQRAPVTGATTDRRRTARGERQSPSRWRDIKQGQGKVAVKVKVITSFSKGANNRRRASATKTRKTSGEN